MIYNIKPFPAVRVNGKGGRFTPRAIQYHSKISELRKLFNDKESLLKAMVYGNYEIIFYIPMPKSWSKKKKSEMVGMPHKQKPDIDNLFKAFTDTLFYQEERYDDKEIYIINAKKYWSEEGYIELNIY